MQNDFQLQLSMFFCFVSNFAHHFSNMKYKPQLGPDENRAEFYLSQFNVDIFTFSFLGI